MMRLHITLFQLAASYAALLGVIAICLSSLAPMGYSADARAANEERINELSLEITVNVDGSMMVTESILGTTTGERIKQGIVHIFGTRPVEILEIVRDGKPVKYQGEATHKRLRVYVGEPGVFFESGQYSYMLKYNTFHRMLFTDKADYFYWNVTEFLGLPVDSASVTMTLPYGVTGDMVNSGAYIASEDGRPMDYEKEIDGQGRLVLRTKRALAADDVFMVFAVWPPGFVTRPKIERYSQPIAAGESHSCAITEGQTIRCWGNNGAGQLGDGTTTSSDEPITVSSIEYVLGVTANRGHTCAWTSARVAYCWGIDFVETVRQAKLVTSTLPVEIEHLSGVVQVTAGYEHVCALLQHGEVRCWGANSVGQLGNGSIEPSAEAVSVRTSESAVFIDAGVSHTCAALIGGRVECWGSDSQGRKQGGLDSTRPTSVVGVSDAIAVSAGRNFSCALTASGQVVCWGSNIGGMLGRSGAGMRAGPGYVENLIQVNEVDSGMFHTCAKLKSGKVACWGEPIPAGSLEGGTRYAHVIEGIDGAVDIAAGAGHSCAQIESGVVKCWGYNNAGQLGDGSMNDSSAAVEVDGL